MITSPFGFSHLWLLTILTSLDAIVSPRTFPLIITSLGFALCKPEYGASCQKRFFALWLVERYSELVQVVERAQLIEDHGAQLHDSFNLFNEQPRPSRGCERCGKAAWFHPGGSFLHQLSDFRTEPLDLLKAL